MCSLNCDDHVAVLTFVKASCRAPWVYAIFVNYPLIELWGRKRSLLYTYSLCLGFFFPMRLPLANISLYSLFVSFSLPRLQLVFPTGNIVLNPKYPEQCLIHSAHPICMYWMDQSQINTLIRAHDSGNLNIKITKTTLPFQIPQLSEIYIVTKRERLGVSLMHRNSAFIKTIWDDKWVLKLLGVWDHEVELYCLYHSTNCLWEEILLF